MNKLPLSRTAWSTWIAGVLACMLGLMVLLGWLLGSVVLIRILPNGSPMVPVTAVCFVLGGLSLVLTPFRAVRWGNPLRSLLLGILVVLSVAILFQVMFGLDWGIDHAGLNSVSSITPDQPGPMAPNTALGFLLFGIAALLHIHAPETRLSVLVRGFTFLVFLLGLFGIVSHLLNLQDVYPDFYKGSGLAGTAFHTACGMVVLSLGLWGLWYFADLRKVPEVERDDIRIKHTTIFVLHLVGLVAGLIGFSLLQLTMENENSANLLSLLKDRGTFVDTVIEYRTHRAQVASEQSIILAASRKIHSRPDDQEAMTLLRTAAQGLLKHEFSGISLEVDGKRSLLAGEVLDDKAFSVPVGGHRSPIALSWHGGYYLRLRHPLADPDTGAIYGSLLTEQRLNRLEQLQNDTGQWGATGAMLICGATSGNQLPCFPYRSEPRPGNIPISPQDLQLPMLRAVQNQTGVGTTLDYRGRRVIAAYGPVASTGLGMVVRMETAEIYAPVRQQLAYGVPAIFIMIALGMELIRSRIKPLVKKMIAMHMSAEKERANFIAATESTPDAFFVLENCKNEQGEICDFRFIYLNPNVKRAFPHIAEDLTGQSLIEKFPYQLNFFEKFKKVGVTGVMLDEEFTWGGREAPKQWINLQVVQMPHGVAVTWRDLTGKRNSERLLEESNRLRKTIVDSAAYAIISTDVNGVILSFNQGAERLLGYQADELIHQKTPAIFHDADEVANRAAFLSLELGRKIEPGFEVFIAKVNRDQNEEREWTYIRKDGTRVPVRLSATVLCDADDKIIGYLGVAHDITEQKRMAEYMQHVALHDVLTGLPNRALLDDRVKLAINNARRNKQLFALALLDIDRFKQINDTLGHHVGDQVLVDFVERLKSCVRPNDTFARMGGDEFVMVFPDCDKAGASTILNRILEMLLPPMRFGDSDLQVTSSIGISIFPDHGEDQAVLMRHADAAMYVVKQQGRNGYKIFSPEMEIELKK